MLLTTFYLSERILYVLQGRYRKEKLEIRFCAAYDLPKNSMIMGEINRPQSVMDVLNRAAKDLGKGRHKVELLTDSGLAVIKPMNIPKMTKKRTQNFVRLEMARFFRFQETYLFDNTILVCQKRMQYILGGAMKCEMVSRYQNLFSDCKMELVSMKPALNGVIRLFSFLPKWKDKHVLAVYYENEKNVLLIEIKAGIYHNSNQIYCAEGVDSEKGSERLAGQILAFYYLKESKNPDRGLDGVVFCGNRSQDRLVYSKLAPVLKDALCYLNDSSGMIKAEGASYSLMEFCSATGNLLGGNIRHRDMNFIHASRRPDKKNSRKRTAAFVLPLVLTGAIAGMSGFYSWRVKFYDRQCEVMLKKTEELRIEEDKEKGMIAEEASDWEAFCSNAAGVSAVLHSYADLTDVALDKVWSQTGNAVTLNHLEYANGHLVIAASTVSYGEAYSYLQRLKESDVFASITYSGFQKKEGYYHFTVDCLLKSGRANDEVD